MLSANNYSHGIHRKRNKPLGLFELIAIALAAYSYVKLAVFYKDEGATYSFYKRTFPDSPFAASLIGWWVVFGYISTLAFLSLMGGTALIIYFELKHQPQQLLYIAGLYAVLTIGAWFYSRKKV